MDLSLLTALNAERSARRAAILVTDTAGGTARLVREAEIASDPLAEELAERLRSGKSGTLEVDGRSLFLTVQMPPVRLVAIGAVHISQALAPMAKGLDLDVTIIDPRTAFATPERFPDVAVLAEWPADALPKLGGLDRYTAVTCLTHDPKVDDPALEAAGFGETDIARIHAPIGLDIGAVSPAEIAVSILAELVAELRRDRRRAT
jgi:xanthine dehydrogenase accessory factor